MKHPSSHYRSVSTDILGIGCRYLGTFAANFGTTDLIEMMKPALIYQHMDF